MSFRTSKRHLKLWGTSASNDPLRQNINASAETYSHAVTRPTSVDNQEDCVGVSLNADWTNSPAAPVTSPNPIIDPFVLPICEEVDVTIAYLDHLPEEVSVTVDNDLLHDIEVAASMPENPQDAVQFDESESSTNPSERSSDEFTVDIDLMLALRRWNGHVHNSRDAMGRLLSILHETGHTDLPLDWRSVLHRCQVVDAIMVNDNQYKPLERTSLFAKF